jgi:hypothetical protein
MSIWSSFHTIEPVHAPAYRWDNLDIIDGGYVDLAATSHYNGLRLCVQDDSITSDAVVLTPEQAEGLRDALTEWLEAHR